MQTLKEALRLFGYIRPCQPQLRVCELEVYKGIYCGLCAGLGRSFGLLMRATLSYDAAFLAMLGLALRKQPPQLPRRRCTFNPMKQVCCCEPAAEIDYAADVSALMLRLKLEDNVRDPGFWRRMASRLGLWVFGGTFHRAQQRRPELARELAELAARQNELEERGCTCLDEACEPTARMMQAVLSRMDPAQERVLSRLGYLLGRYVYLADAVDDLEKDRRTGSYNPLLKSAWVAQGAGDAALRQEGLGSICLTTGEICTTWQLLDVCHFQPILDNIFLLGLRSVADTLAAPDRGKMRRARWTGNKLEAGNPAEWSK